MSRKPEIKCVLGRPGACPWQGMAKRSECCGISAGVSVTLMIQMREVHQNWDERCVTELR